MTYYRSLALFLAVTIIMYACGIIAAHWLLDFYFMPVHDEVHFIKAVRVFGDSVSLKTLAQYNETSGPLPFMMYGLWGRIFGFGMPVMRALSLVLALLTLVCVHRLFWNFTNKAKITLFASLFVAANPYMLALSVLVYTDMAALLFLFAGIIALESKKPWAYSGALACALLCRQFFIFFPMAVFAAGILRFIATGKKQALAFALGSVISIIPLLALMFFVWGGICPQNATQTAWVQGMTGFHPGFIILYVALVFIYLFPFIIYKRQVLYTPWIVGFSCALSALYFLFPAGPSTSGLRYGLVFTGFFHRLVALILSASWFFHIIFFLSFLLGLPVILRVIKDMAVNARKRNFGFAFTLDLSIILFFIIMPFSYLAWEKYLLPVLPLILARLLDEGA